MLCWQNFANFKMLQMKGESAWKGFSLSKNCSPYVPFHLSPSMYITVDVVSTLKSLQRVRRHKEMQQRMKENIASRQHCLCQLKLSTSFSAPICPFFFAPDWLCSCSFKCAACIEFARKLCRKFPHYTSLVGINTDSIQHEYT